MDNLSMSIQLYASSKIFEKGEGGGCLLRVDWIVGELDCWRSLGKLEEFGGSMGGGRGVGGGGEGIWWEGGDLVGGRGFGGVYWRFCGFGLVVGGLVLFG